MADLEDIIEELKEQNDTLQIQLDNVMNERDRQVGELEDQIANLKSDLEKEWKSKMADVERKCRMQLEAMNNELDTMRTAFSGDSSGWSIKKKKNGLEYYENVETGEIRDEMPEVLFIATAMQKVEDAEKQIDELNSLREKIKDAEMRKREAETAVNKIRTEVNTLRQIEKGWKETSKSISIYISNVGQSFDKQVNDVIDGMDRLSEGSVALKRRIPMMRRAKDYVAKLQEKISAQEDTIKKLKNNERRMTNELDELNRKVKRLSTGIDEEVERLIKPMREKVTECMVNVMKEKAARAQERRELADLWPPGHLMPSILMKYRALSEEELTRRKIRSQERDASRALALEIRANVSESRQWEIKYDEYGRNYYEHKVTGQTEWEQPEIMNYKPPPGRDEMGNVLLSEEVKGDWQIMCDYKGTVYYQSNTGEISYEPPDAYLKIPRGKEAHLFVGEAAHIVLSYIKSKIASHVELMQLKEERRRRLEEGTLTEDEKAMPIEEDTKEDLTQYLYDIETVEMLADVFANAGKGKGKAEERVIYEDTRSDVISYQEAKDSSILGSSLQYSGPSLLDVDVTESSVDDIKEIVRHHALMEERLERRIAKCREHLKDFSYVLMERLDDERRQEDERRRQIQEQLDERARQRQKVIDKKKRIREKNKQRLLRSGKSMQEIVDAGYGDEEDEASLALASSTITGATPDDTKEGETVDGDSAVVSVPKEEDDDLSSIGQQSLTSAKTDKSPALQALGRQSSMPLTAEKPKPVFSKAHSMMDMRHRPDEGVVSDDDSDLTALLIMGDVDYGIPNFNLHETPGRFSEEMILACDNLIHFALFAGFENLRINDNPADLPVIRSNYGDNSDESFADDQWLTHSFFITVSKEHVDGIRQATEKPYDSILGVLGTQYLNSVKLINDLHDLPPEGERQEGEPYNPRVNFVNNQLQVEHSNWKARQLMSEVLRFQLQQEAIRHRQAELDRLSTSAARSENRSVNKFVSDEDTNEDEVQVYILSAVGLNIHREEVGEHKFYVRISIGSVVTTFPSASAVDGRIQWVPDTTPLITNRQRLRVVPMKVELLDENEMLASPCIGRAVQDLSLILYRNTGEKRTLELSMRNVYGQEIGTLQLCVRVDAASLDEALVDEKLHIDSLSEQKQLLNDNIVSRKISLNRTDTNQSFSFEDTQDEFADLVAMLRGDGDIHVKAITANVKKEDLERVGRRIGPNIVKRLPNFKITKTYLQNKANVHVKDIKSFLYEIDEHYEFIDEAIHAKIEAITKLRNDAAMKHATMTKNSEGLQEDVKKIQVKLAEVRTPAPQPNEPKFEPFPDLPLVPDLPKQTGLDSKGKKKKDLKGSEVKAFVAKTTSGEMDATSWDFGERFPNPSQMATLQKAVQQRNHALLEERHQAQAQRDKIMEIYTQAMQNWEKEDRARRNEYERIKKESRKLYLKVDCTEERLNIVLNEVNGHDEDIRVYNDFLKFHAQAKDQVKIMRAKQHLESERQRKSLQNMKNKLLALLDARHRALEYPGGATNEVEFQTLKERSEIALRTLRYEIVDCKQNVIDEGVRLRNMLNEELCTVKSELSRVRMLHETINQRNALDKILERHKYEVFQLLEDMEKLKLVEADKDDRGLKDTIDDIGERYIKEKEWSSPQINQLMKTVDLIMSKISLTDGVKSSAAKSQQCIFESMAVKWGTDFCALRDSWCENSDYVRAQRLQQDLVQWVALQSEKMSMKEKEFALTKLRSKAELEAFARHLNMSKQCHDNETTIITDSSASVIGVIREQMVKLDQSSKARMVKLEKSITALSRECHAVREEKYKQALDFGGKIDSLMSLVATLQTTLEHQSAAMEVLKEERDDIVINTRLESDRLRHQLRMERRHCANLLFIIHGQRAVVQKLSSAIQEVRDECDAKEQKFIEERRNLRNQIWEQLYVFTRMSTDVDDLFDFFANRLANISGARKSLNDALNRNGAAVVLAALCRCPRPSIRKCAARALAGLGWDGYVETRVLMWDCVMQWNAYRDRILADDQSAYQGVKDKFLETGKTDGIANMFEDTDDFQPSSNASLRTIIKQRRQWALRAARRREGPNIENLRTINIHDGVIPALIRLCMEDGTVDWEIVRNAALAVSVASFEEKNLHSMVQNNDCVELVLFLLVQDDPEIAVHGALTLANMCHENQQAQIYFGSKNAIPSLLLLCTSTIPDVQEAATAALSNLTCICDQNCLRFLKADGVAVTVKLLTSSRSENFLDMDQNDEIQSNAAQILANISRFDCDFTVKYFNGAVLDVLILSCASTNKMVRRHCPLVIGNVSQSEWCRREIGARGGVEALFLALEDSDVSVQANCLWALCNLMWFPPNQERAGRFITEIVHFLRSTWLPVQMHASILLANVLYYNNPNRIRFLETEGSIELIASYVKDNKEWTVVESCLRALLSLSYNDDCSMWLATDGAFLPTLLKMIQPPVSLQSSCTRYAVEIINNMCVHHLVRRALLDMKGLDMVVNLLGHDDPNVQETARQIIEHLEDVTPPEVLAKAKSMIGIERMITLSTNADPLVRAVAAETIGEEVWRDPRKQELLNNLRGVESLLAICANQQEIINSVLPALWSLRNLLHNNPKGQMQFRDHDGTVVVMRVLSRCLTGEFSNQSGSVLEACLACLAVAIHNHELNSRRLLRVGLEMLLDIAENRLGDAVGADKHVQDGLSSLSVVALTKSLLSMLGPYNYVVCKNCHKKQNLLGTHCISCGYKFVLEDKIDDSAERLKLRSPTAKKVLMSKSMK